MVRPPKVRALTIRFTQDEFDMLEAASEAEDVSVATIVRKAVTAYASQRPTPPPSKGAQLPARKPAKK